jgi:hypothetical protein
MLIIRMAPIADATGRCLSRFFLSEIIDFTNVRDRNHRLALAAVGIIPGGQAAVAAPGGWPEVFRTDVFQKDVLRNAEPKGAPRPCQPRRVRSVQIAAKARASMVGRGRRCRSRRSVDRHGHLQAEGRWVSGRQRTRIDAGLEHFPQKWIPVLRKKMRQTRNLERPI